VVYPTARTIARDVSVIVDPPWRHVPLAGGLNSPST